MADISVINLPDNTQYNIKDSSARSSLNNKLDKNQGTANAGKFLVVNSSGVVEPVAMTAWQGGNY